MTDDKTLVERLRAAADDGELSSDTFEQAAARFEALEAALRRMVDHLAGFNRDYSDEATAETAAIISEAYRLLGADR